MSEVNTQVRSSDALEIPSAAEAYELATRGPGSIAAQADERAKAPLGIGYVADFCSRYPGEPVTFFARVEVRQAVAGFTVRVSIPDGLVVDDFGGVGVEALAVVENAPDGSKFIVWRLAEPQQPGARHEYYIRADMELVYRARQIESHAWVYLGANGSSALVDAESVAITCVPKGSYVRFLPALYEQDDLMGRFLMLFESFWRPLSAQISSIDYYFDPKITPAALLPWLASWMNLQLDDHWTEEKQRRLLSSIMRLYRKRGTKAGLQEYLEIFAGGSVEISERRANNFRLGEQARLGVGIALGTGNVPHTFSVKIDLPPIRSALAKGAVVSDEDLELYDQERRRILKGIIDSEKPAHTRFTLEFESIEST